MSGVPHLVLGEGAAAVRRQVGPMSWTALEVLAALGDEANRAVTSVRDVADELAVSKNAAHRAIRRLVDAGLVVPLQARSTDGRFLVGSYRLTVPADVVHRATEEPAPTTRVTSRTTRRAAPTRRRHADDAAHLTLLTP